MTMHREEITL